MAGLQHRVRPTPMARPEVGSSLSTLRAAIAAAIAIIDDDDDDDDEMDHQDVGVYSPSAPSVQPSRQ